jgi:hypothetical protein
MATPFLKNFNGKALCGVSIDLGRKDEAMLELFALNQSEGKPIPGQPIPSGSATTNLACRKYRPGPVTRRALKNQNSRQPTRASSLKFQDDFGGDLTDGVWDILKSAVHICAVSCLSRSSLSNFCWRS